MAQDAVQSHRPHYRRRTSVSKATSDNPKDLFGNKKLPLHLIPSTAQVAEALAMADGAGKYGPYNWRDKAVLASIYVAACKRHIDLWFEGQQVASDSGVHHLGHARACLGILIDAEANDCLVDDRPKPADLETLFKDAEAVIEAMHKRHAELPHNKPNPTMFYDGVNVPVLVAAEKATLEIHEEAERILSERFPTMTPGIRPGYGADGLPKTRKVPRGIPLDKCDRHDFGVTQENLGDCDPGC
jgi:hypothetical protein